LLPPKDEFLPERFLQSACQGGRMARRNVRKVFASKDLSPIEQRWSEPQSVASGVGGIRFYNATLPKLNSGRHFRLRATSPFLVLQALHWGLFSTNWTANASS
jgi:hypothetical protein